MAPCARPTTVGELEVCSYLPPALVLSQVWQPPVPLVIRAPCTTEPWSHTATVRYSLQVTYVYSIDLTAHAPPCSVSLWVYAIVPILHLLMCFVSLLIYTIDQISHITLCPQYIWVYRYHGPDFNFTSVNCISLGLYHLPDFTCDAHELHLSEYTTITWYVTFLQCAVSEYATLLISHVTLCTKYFWVYR